MITGKNYIGNVLSSIGDVTYKTFNPQENCENDIYFTEASDIEIEEAVSLALQAFNEFKEEILKYHDYEISEALLEVTSEERVRVYKIFNYEENNDSDNDKNKEQQKKEKTKMV